MSMLDDNASPKPTGLAADQSCALSPETFAPAAAAAVVPAAASPADVALPPAEGALPSDCGCGGGKGPEYVYAIGSLSYDFGTATRRDSLQQHAEPIRFRDEIGKVSPQKELPLDLTQPKDFLRHVLGFSEFQLDRPNSSAQPIETNRHLPRPNDLKAVHWLLVRDGVNPLYALAPRGPFAERMYEELASFLLSQIGLKKEQLDVYYVIDAKSGKLTIVNPPVAVAPEDPTPYCAMPGMLLTGEIRLLSGQAVSAINPDQRGTLSWSKEKFRSKLPKTLAGDTAEAILDRLLEETRNAGRTGVERAKNFFASRVLDGASVADGVGRHVTKWTDVHLADVVVKQSRNARQGSQNYDVEIELFDPNAVTSAMLVLSQTVDVADVVPALVDLPRQYRRR